MKNIFGGLFINVENSNLYIDVFDWIIDRIMEVILFFCLFLFFVNWNFKIDISIYNLMLWVGII